MSVLGDVILLFGILLLPWVWATIMDYLEAPDRPPGAAAERGLPPPP